jgi:16S rRNA (uracil1498-N3)-methyltransferase
VSDGAGGWRRCRFGPALEPLTEVAREPRPEPWVTVAFAPVKGDRPEWAVQKLTELGVDRIVPLLAARSVVRWPAGRGHLDRLRRVAREAAVQSRRTWLPVVDDVLGFDAVAAAVAAAAEAAAEGGVALAHPGGGPPTLARPMVLVGPEGGWDDRELAAGLPQVGLGPRILRTETAAVVAGTLLCALRAGTVRSADPGG